MEQLDKKLIFEARLAHLLNEFGLDSDCKTPQFVLARYIVAFLEAYKQTVAYRNEWSERLEYEEL